jgi:hypothetical protein
MLKKRKGESKKALAYRKKRRRSIPVSPLECVEKNCENLRIILSYPLN